MTGATHPTPAGASARFRTEVSRQPFRKGRHSDVTAAPEALDDYTLVFEGRCCGRCGGSGRIAQFGHVLKGICFSCGGAGGVCTRRGRTAKGRFNALCDRALPVLREEVKPGDRVWNHFRGLSTWCPVVEVRDDNRPHSSSIGARGDKTIIHYRSMFCITIDHPYGRYRACEGTGQGYTVPRWDPQRVAAIVNEVAGMPGAVLQLNEVG